MGAVRSKRFAMVVEDMKVTYIGVETKYVHFLLAIMYMHTGSNHLLSTGIFTLLFFSNIGLVSLSPVLLLSLPSCKNNKSPLVQAMFLLDGFIYAYG